MPRPAPARRAPPGPRAGCPPLGAAAARHRRSDEPTLSGAPRRFVHGTYPPRHRGMPVLGAAQEVLAEVLSAARSVTMPSSRSPGAWRSRPAATCGPGRCSGATRYGPEGAGPDVQPSCTGRARRALTRGTAVVRGGRCHDRRARRRDRDHVRASTRTTLSEARTTIVTSTAGTQRTWPSLTT